MIYQEWIKSSQPVFILKIYELIQNESKYTAVFWQWTLRMRSKEVKTLSCIKPWTRYQISNRFYEPWAKSDIWSGKVMIHCQIFPAHNAQIMCLQWADASVSHLLEKCKMSWKDNWVGNRAADGKNYCLMARWLKLLLVSSWADVKSLERTTWLRYIFTIIWNWFHCGPGRPIMK